MFNFKTAAMAACLLMSTTATAADNLQGEVAQLRALLTAMKSDYEDRITQLEQRLERAERSANRARRGADEALEIAEQTAISASAGASAANTFNPAIGAVLIAGYADVDAGWEAIPGFQPGGELGPGGKGFSLGESEINFKANIDSRFFGNLTLALEDDDGETEIGVEEAWVQTTALPSGLTLRAGRHFSAAGYLNQFHRHADDFADRPLPYQAFLGGQYIADGAQLSWIAPTDRFLELGAELSWGSRFPAAAGQGSSPDAYTLFASTGGDVGLSHSWQLGLSWLAADAAGRGGDAADDPLFTGDSDLAGIDFVWKWAPGGNPVQHNFKLQGEYFRRSEDGRFGGLPYSGDQDGWYLQGLWQFRQGWRAGYRYDTVDADNGAAFAGTTLADPGRSSSRNSLMVEWLPSEYSRIRLQYTDDRVLETSDRQLFLQYIMSIGAHGAHQF